MDLFRHKTQHCPQCLSGSFVDLLRHKTQHCPQCLSGSFVDLLCHKTQQCPNVFPAVSWICFAITPSSGIPSNQSGSGVFESKLTAWHRYLTVSCAVSWLYLRCIKAFYHILIYAQIFLRWCLILYLSFRQFRGSASALKPVQFHGSVSP